jgi:hypothetical protein
MTIKEQIQKDLQSESTGWPADTVGSMINDSNHVMRRFFRCYLDGSYGNQEDYTRNCDYLRENEDKPKRLRSFLIMRFTSYIAKEYDCHYSTAQKSITSAFSKTDLERLTVELIDDALDLIRD